MSPISDKFEGSPVRLALGLLMSLIVMARPVVADTRIALIIGSSDYATPGLSLLNPVNDAAPLSAVAGPRQFELTFWASIKDNKEAADFQDYLNRYPKGAFVTLAQRKIENLQKPISPAAPAQQIAGSSASEAGPLSASQGSFLRDAGYIGISLAPDSGKLAQSLNAKVPYGALVEGVDPGLPADKAGIKRGDLILRLDGKPVDGSNDLSRMIIDAVPGQSLEMMLLRGGQKIQLPIAITGRRREAELGNAAAMGAVGDLYFFGVVGVVKDYGEAMRWYRKAADLGNVRAMVRLGTVYTNGKVVPADYAEAMRWYRKAAELGNLDAMTSVADFYYNGKGIPTDYFEAMHWYRNAADLGNSNAMYDVGSLYSKGLGVTHDYVEAMRWFRSAAGLGNVPAMVAMGPLYDHGAGVTKDEAEAKHWYRKAAALGNTEAEKWLNDQGH
jgi:TPR repeat protein